MPCERDQVAVNDRREEIALGGSLEASRRLYRSHYALVPLLRLSCLNDNRGGGHTKDMRTVSSMGYHSQYYVNTRIDYVRVGMPLEWKQRYK